MSFETCIQQLNANDPHQRSEAVLQLGKLNDSRAVKPLVDVLCNDADLNVQEDATWSLVRYGDHAVDALLRVLPHDDARVRHNIVHTLGKLKRSSAVSALVTMTTDSDARVRYKAIYALGQIAVASAIPAIIARLEDEVLDVQYMAQEVLKGFGTTALDPLIAELPHGSILKRDLIIALLGEVNDPRAIQAIKTVLNDDEWQIRFAAVHALGEINHPEAWRVLEALTGDDDPRIRALATRLAAG